MAVHRQRRYGVEFKLQLVRSYLAGEGILKGIAAQHGLNHSLLLCWIKKFQAGELTDDDHLADQIHEYQAQIAALERKVGQLTMELDVQEKGAARCRTDDKRAVVAHLRTLGVSVPEGCRLMTVARSAFYERSTAAERRRAADTALLLDPIKQIAAEQPARVSADH